MKDVTRWNKEYTNNKDLRDYFKGLLRLYKKI